MYAGRKLTDVLDSEVHGRVMEVAQTFASDYNLDQLREKKGEMSLAIQKDVTSFFLERGITVTNIGMFGGFSYENIEIQSAIDKVFVTQQLKNTTKATLEAQNSINEKMISEAKAKANAAKEEAEGKAQAYVLEAEGKAKAVALEVKAIAEAQNNPLFIETRRLEITKEFNSRWDGKLPASYIGSDNVTTLMGIPPIQAK
jgi:regulator of protease activity HflC (stomatin/prohibitin superfamily)